MKTKIWLVVGLLAGLSAAVPAGATTVVVDDFLGGPSVASLTSLLPPQIATASFAHGGAVGGWRNAAVWSYAAGDFAAGVAFGSGGYASFVGTGAGGIAWTGAPGLADTDASKTITPDELTYGLGLDLSDCVDGKIEVTAFADLPAAVLRIAIGSSATDFNRYDIALTGPVGSFNPYEVDLSSPSSFVGSIDWSDVGAIALFVDGSAFANLDVLVSRLQISCPDGGTTVGLMGVAMVGLGLVGRRYRR